MAKPNAAMYMKIIEITVRNNLHKAALIIMEIPQIGNFDSQPVKWLDLSLLQHLIGNVQQCPEEQGFPRQRRRVPYR